MKKSFVLPKFKDEDEERDFWDKVDITEYFEPSDFKHVDFPHLKRSSRLISIRFPDSIIEEAKEKAKRLDIPYQRLLREIVQQGLKAIRV